MALATRDSSLLEEKFLPQLTGFKRMDLIFGLLKLSYNRLFYKTRPLLAIF